MYGSTESNPKYVTDESCFFVGDFRIDFKDPKIQKNLNKIIEVSLVLGDTELRVEVDVFTKESHSAQFKLKAM